MGWCEYEEPSLSQLSFPDIDGQLYGMSSRSGASFGDRFSSSALCGELYPTRLPSGGQGRTTATPESPGDSVYTLPQSVIVISWFFSPCMNTKIKKAHPHCTQVLQRVNKTNLSLFGCALTDMYFYCNRYWCITQISHFRHTFRIQRVWGAATP